VGTLEAELTGSISALGGEIDVWSKGASHPLLSRIPESYAETIKEISGVREAVPAVLALATLETDTTVAIGISPRGIPILFEYEMVSGTMIDGNVSGRIALGELLAERFGKVAGDNVFLNDVEFQVTGVYRTRQWLDLSVFLPLQVAQQLFGVEGGASLVIVTTEDPQRIDDVIGEIKTRISTVEVFRRDEAVSKITPVFSSVQRIASAITVVVLLGSVFGIMNSNLNSLRERSQSFAIFKAVGASRGQVVRVIVYESLLLGALGGLLGSLLSYAALRTLSIQISETATIQLQPQASVFAIGGLLVMASSMTAALYPAVRISRVRPQEVFRFG